MTDNRETPAATGSQRDVPSRSTTKRISRAKDATAVETKDSTAKAPARKRAPKIEATNAVPMARVDSKQPSTRSVTGKRTSAAAEPAVATAANTRQDNSPIRQPSGNEARVAPRDISPAERRDMIRRIAYFRAEWRGWTPGAELDDWLHAEREVDALLRSDHSA